MPQYAFTLSIVELLAKPGPGGVCRWNPAPTIHHLERAGIFNEIASTPAAKAGTPCLQSFIRAYFGF